MVHPSLKFGHIHKSLLSKCADRTKQNWNVAFCMSACTLFRSVCAPFRPGATQEKPKKAISSLGNHHDLAFVFCI